MKYINLIKKSALATCIVITLSACTSGGSGTEVGLNLTGNWRASGTSLGSPVEVTLALAQTRSSAGGVREVPIDGVLSVEYPAFICVLNFKGGSLNTETGVLIIEPGNDEGSLIGTATSNNSITATASGSIDDGCNFKTSVLTFTRV